MMPAPKPVHLVFVHGLFSSTKVWNRFKQLISADPELSSFVTVQCFGYPSPRLILRPDRRIAGLDDLGDRLGTYLSRELSRAESVVLVTHSQGGLIVQRYLARSIRRQHAEELARIKRIVMFACPNSGSEFLLAVRKTFVLYRNRQERELRPFNQAVAETFDDVVRHVVNARGHSNIECHIPIAAYAGLSDNIVKSFSTLMSSTTGTVDGDHFSIIQPIDASSSSFMALKHELRATSTPDHRHDEDPEDDQREDSGGEPGEWPRRFSVAPPLGQIHTPLQGEDRRRIIAAVLSTSGASNAHVLAGMGGAGKSRLALEIASRALVAKRRVWWIPMTRINASMREVANQLGAPEAQVEGIWRGAGSATDLVWHFLNQYPEPWVLIFDNADAPAALGPEGGQVSDGTGWLRKPASPHGTVIVTSRDHSQATWGTWIVLHRVVPLNDTDGAALLMNQVDHTAGTNEQARQVSSELGGLPLALCTAASLINVGISSGDTTITSFPGYQQAVRRQFQSPPGEPGHNQEELIDRTVREVFDLSLTILTDRGLHEAAPLLKLFACLSIAPIPYRLLLTETVLSESTLLAEFIRIRRNMVIKALADLDLVTVLTQRESSDREMTHLLTLHPVVHGILRDDQDVQERRAEYYGLNIRMLLAPATAHDPDYPGSWAVWDMIAPHCLEVARTTLLSSNRIEDGRVITSALELARLTARYLIVTGLLKPASDLVVPIIDGCQFIGFDQNDREILALRHEKARIALEQANPAAAESELKEVIAGRERVLGPDHPRTLASRHKLAKAVLEQGRWSEAEPLLRRIIAAENEVRGVEEAQDADTMVVRHSLARAILAQNRAAEAETMLRNILAVRYSLWAPSTPETLYARQTLARTLLDQERFGEALSELREALHTAADRPRAPRVLSLRHTVTQTLLMQGRVHEARAEAERLLTDQEKVLGSSHPDTERTRELLQKINTIPPETPE